MLSEDKVCRIEIVTQGILSDIYLHAYYYMYLLHHIVRDLTKNDKYCISSNNSPGAINFFFFAPKGGDYSREAIISNISHRRSCPKYFVLLYH